MIHNFCSLIYNENELRKVLCDWVDEVIKPKRRISVEDLDLSADGYTRVIELFRDGCKLNALIAKVKGSFVMYNRNPAGDRTKCIKNLKTFAKQYKLLMDKYEKHVEPYKKSLKPVLKFDYDELFDFDLVSYKSDSRPYKLLEAKVLEAVLHLGMLAKYDKDKKFSESLFPDWMYKEISESKTTLRILQDGNTFCVPQFWSTGKSHSFTTSSISIAKPVKQPSKRDEYEDIPHSLVSPDTNSPVRVRKTSKNHGDSMNIILPKADITETDLCTENDIDMTDLSSSEKEWIDNDSYGRDKKSVDREIEEYREMELKKLNQYVTLRKQQEERKIREEMKKLKEVLLGDVEKEAKDEKAKQKTTTSLRKTIPKSEDTNELEIKIRREVNEEYEREIIKLKKQLREKEANLKLQNTLQPRLLFESDLEDKDKEINALKKQVSLLQQEVVQLNHNIRSYIQEIKELTRQRDEFAGLHEAEMVIAEEVEDEENEENEENAENEENKENEELAPPPMIQEEEEDELL